MFTEEVQAEYFNDDALGRCLDAIDDYGVTKLFSELALTIGVEHKLLGRTFNIDTTSLTVYGEYDEDEISESSATSSTQDPSSGAVPRYGFSKEHQYDLKQMVLNLATTGKGGFPIWMEAHSGNASDQKILYQAAERMKTLCPGLKEAPAFMTVGDSALYDACLKGGAELLWLTRVPERRSKRLIAAGR